MLFTRALFEKNSKTGGIVFSNLPIVKRLGLGLGLGLWTGDSVPGAGGTKLEAVCVENPTETLDHLVMCLL